MKKTTGKDFMIRTYFQCIFKYKLDYKLSVS